MEHQACVVLCFWFHGVSCFGILPGRSAGGAAAAHLQCCMWAPTVLPVLAPCQAAALAALQQRKAQQAAWQQREREALINSTASLDANSGAPGGRPEHSIHNSGDSQGSFVAAASPPCLSPRHAPVTS